ncbi:hypothetical protein JJB98_05570 [Bradyrhizobium diazoefficiens]|nr:hypothetical protein [Bradyrhizobium diazoefficiens]QQO19408.1 hypothetical protein JJB98_05570 [Bradyrhizobium diazoefficiens]
MPIVRYFVLAGAFVTALLFTLDRFLPPHGERSGGSEVGRPVIRIKSARTLPERIIFDTSTEIAATVSPPVRAAELPDHVVSNASATAEPAKPQPTVTPPLRRNARQAAGLRSTRTAHAANSPRLYGPQIMGGAF